MSAVRTWMLLADRAEAKAREALAEVVRLQRILDAFDTPAERLRELHADYCERLHRISDTPRPMSEALNLRRFIEHIEGLQADLERKRMAAAAAVATARETHAKVEQEHTRMRGLADRANEKIRRAAQIAETRQMDALGVARFKLGRR